MVLSGVGFGFPSPHAGVAMLIIWGFRIRFRTTATVEFFCPCCGGDRHGDLRTARRWFAAFWIPLVPLKEVGQVVECTTCRTRFDPAAASQSTTAALSVVLANAVRVLTAIIVRSGDHHDEALRSAAVTGIRRATDDYDDATLASDVAAVEPWLAEQYVDPLADGLHVAGKERLLADLVTVALAGGTVTEDQRRVIDLAGRGLGLTPVHVTGIVASVAAARTPEPHPPADDASPGA